MTVRVRVGTIWWRDGTQTPLTTGSAVNPNSRGGMEHLVVWLQCHHGMDDSESPPEQAQGALPVHAPWSVTCGCGVKLDDRDTLQSGLVSCWKCGKKGQPTDFAVLDDVVT